MKALISIPFTLLFSTLVSGYPSSIEEGHFSEPSQEDGKMMQTEVFPIPGGSYQNTEMMMVRPRERYFGRSMEGSWDNNRDETPYQVGYNTGLGNQGMRTHMDSGRQYPLPYPDHSQTYPSQGYRPEYGNNYRPMTSGRSNGNDYSSSVVGIGSSVPELPGDGYDIYGVHEQQRPRPQTVDGWRDDYYNSRDRGGNVPQSSGSGTYYQRYQQSDYNRGQDQYRDSDRNYQQQQRYPYQRDDTYGTRQGHAMRFHSFHDYEKSYN